MMDYMHNYDDEEMERMTKEMSDKDKEAYGDYGNYMRAKNDVKTFVEYNEIHTDPERKKMAIHCASEQRKALAKAEGA